MTKTRRRTRSPKRQTAADTATQVAHTLGVAYLQERLQAAVQPLVTAALEAAIGVRHLYEKDPATGQWARVTDPEAIAARLNEPHVGVTEHRIVVYEQDPDARLLEGLLTFVLGAPFDPALYPSLVETIEVDADTGELTIRVNEAFLADVRRPRAGQAPGSPPTERLPSLAAAARRQVH